MSEPRAQRTLVKSPPELWAEISDVSMLARHLGEFGDIRITRLEAETTVVWEGDRACGTVTLEPSGWGTKVTITAEAVAAEAVEEPAIVEAPAVTEAPAIVEPRAEAEPPKDAEPVAETPPAAEVEAEAELADAPEAEAPRRRSLFARLFARRVKPAAVEPTEPAAVEPEPQPAAVEPEPVAARPEPIVEPALDGEIAATVPSGTLAADQVEAVLVGVLDDLGSAHHRPFSRG